MSEQGPTLEKRNGRRVGCFQLRRCALRQKTQRRLIAEVAHQGAQDDVDPLLPERPQDAPQMRLEPFVGDPVGFAARRNVAYRDERLHQGRRPTSLLCPGAHQRADLLHDTQVQQGEGHAL